jgi:hypothetical protein
VIRLVLLMTALILVVLVTGTAWLMRFAGPASQDGAVSPVRPWPATMAPAASATNYPGRDLTRSGMRVDSARRCADLCARRDECAAMSFAADGSGPGLCFLKGSVPPPTPNASMLSSVKIRHG